tara:strand:- start:86 stop:538 length:453 start_codon:yes stop_codon:yes gene_type:complete
MKKKIFYFFVILLLSNCGFSPMYGDKQKIDYNIFIDKTDGERLINNLITDEMARISDSNSQNIIKIEINTSYDKVVLTKDSKGSATDYRIDMTTNFKMNSNNKIKNIVFRDKQDIKNNSDIFEQKNYEDIIKKNFAISAVNKLRLAILNY